MADPRFKYLTEQQQQDLADGKISAFRASMMNQRQAPNPKYGEGDFITPLLDYTRPAREKMQVYLDKQMEPNPNVSPLIQRGNNLAVGTMQAALNPWENAIKPAGNAVGNVAGATWDMVKDSGFGHLVGNAYDAAFTSQGELQKRKQEEVDTAKALLDTQDAAARARINAFDAITGGLGGDISGQGMIIGPASSGGGGGFQLPPPPGPTDFSGVQDAIDQTKPQWDEADFEGRRKSAILTGLIGGLLKGAMNSDADYGQILGSGGLGVLSGMSEADAAKSAAKEKFTAAMNDYWIRTAGVRQNQAESDAQYAQRVWDVKVKQLQINHEAAQARAAAGQSTIRQAGDKFFVEETVQTPQGPMRQLRPLDMGVVNRLGGMEKQITQMLGDTPDAKKKAESIVAEVAARKDPAYALPMLTIAKLKSSGTYLDAINFITENEPDAAKLFSSASSKAIASGMDESTANKAVDAQRDAMLMSYFMQSAPFRAYTLGNAGLLTGNPDLAAQYDGLLKGTGR